MKSLTPEQMRALQDAQALVVRVEDEYKVNKQLAAKNLEALVWKTSFEVGYDVTKVQFDAEGNVVETPQAPEVPS